MAGPIWIDEALSRELPLLRDRGEGQHLEFMERYPQNGHELSKEIAAFASSNPGSILIGVSDDGALAKLDDVDTAEGRDQLCRRIEGVCSGNVRPAITPVPATPERLIRDRARGRVSANRQSSGVSSVWNTANDATAEFQPRERSGRPGLDSEKTTKQNVPHGREDVTAP